MPDAIVHLIDLFSRYLHIVCTTVLVGGTLFYEMVVPEAVEELKQEQQLDVLGRARWVFKRLVWGAAFVLLVSGVLTTRTHWKAYEKVENGAQVGVSPEGRPMYEKSPSVARRPGWWFVAHASTGLLAVFIALFLTSTRQPPNHPIGWMRLNLVILMVVIFLATVTRHVRSMSTPPANAQDVVRVPFLFPD